MSKKVFVDLEGLDLGYLKSWKNSNLDHDQLALIARRVAQAADMAGFFEEKIEATNGEWGVAYDPSHFDYPWRVYRRGLGLAYRQASSRDMIQSLVDRTMTRQSGNIVNDLLQEVIRKKEGVEK